MRCLQLPCSLSWRPCTVQKGCLEAGGFVHRPLQRRRDRTRRTTNPLKCLDVARGPVCRPHVHDQAPQRFKAIFASAKFAACGLVLRRRLLCTEEFVHLHGGKMPRHVTRLPVSGCASVGESLSTPWEETQYMEATPRIQTDAAPGRPGSGALRSSAPRVRREPQACCSVLLGPQESAVPSILHFSDCNAHRGVRPGLGAETTVFVAVCTSTSRRLKQESRDNAAAQPRKTGTASQFLASEPCKDSSQARLRPQSQKLSRQSDQNRKRTDPVSRFRAVLCRWAREKRPASSSKALKASAGIKGFPTQGMSKPPTHRKMHGDRARPGCRDAGVRRRLHLDIAEDGKKESHDISSARTRRTGTHPFKL